MYRCGDLIKVWSLQSFFGGGFINGRLARVSQDVAPDNNSVLTIIKRKIRVDDENVNGLDTSYEVYLKQTELVKERTEEELKHIKEFLKMNRTLREYEHQHCMDNAIDYHLPYHYAPEFYFDDNTMVHLNKELLKYPEAFI